jgi:hypothetical protein
MVIKIIIIIIKVIQVIIKRKNPIIKVFNFKEWLGQLFNFILLQIKTIVLNHLNDDLHF